MYNLILEALYHLNNLSSVEEQRQYLQSLKPFARQLRKSYDPSLAASVQADYRSTKTQSAYMLRYFPQYSQVIRIILNRLDAQFSLPFKQEELSACFFGAGPAPEVYGFLRFLSTSFSNVQKVTVYTFDIISDEWSYSRKITEGYLIPSTWRDRTLAVVNNEFDLTQINSLNKFSNIIRSSTLNVFQNCLNEISRNFHSNVVDNFKSLVKLMSSGSILMVIDLSSYAGALQLISQIENMIRSENLASVLVSTSNGHGRYDAVSLRNLLPEAITKNLPTGEDGLIPRRYINYHSLIIRKS